MSSLSFRKKLFAAAPYKTLFLGPGRPEFEPGKLPPFESYLTETAKGTLDQIQNPEALDEGIIGSFMAARFLNQANLPGFLPFMVPALLHKPCMGVEGACGTGGRAIAAAMRAVLSDLSESVFVCGFEMQNSVKSVYGADILAGAGYYHGERKEGHAFFFPGVFSDRAAAYRQKFGQKPMREAFARWYERAILNARKDPKAQEFHNKQPDLFKLGMSAPDPARFLPELNLFDCSKISDGAASIIIASEEGLRKLGIAPKEAVEIIGLGEAEADITAKPDQMTRLTTTEKASQKALERSGLKVGDISLFELHDCFTISGLLSLEALGLTEEGGAPKMILEGRLPTINSSGGLIGYGHPTGASGVRQLVDLTLLLTGRAASQEKIANPFGMMVSMGGNDKTVTAIIVRSLGQGLPSA